MAYMPEWASERFEVMSRFKPVSDHLLAAPSRKYREASTWC